MNLPQCVACVFLLMSFHFVRKFLFVVSSIVVVPRLLILSYRCCLPFNYLSFVRTYPRLHLTVPIV